MTEHIVSNLTRNNHLSTLINLFANSDEIIIISPFISSDFNFFPFNKLSHLSKITFVTTLKPRTSDQYKKVKFMNQLFDFCEKQQISLNVLIENSLHGKIYIAKSGGEVLGAVLTSANFTRNGLKINNEWGISISDIPQILAIEKGILSKVVLEPILRQHIDKFLIEIKKQPIPPPTVECGLDLTNQIDLSVNPMEINSSFNYWLKPIGVSNDYIPWDATFDEIDKDLHFSKLRPVGVKVNDILICYAVGHKNILAVYRVKSEVKSTGKKNDRWPYYVIGENITPYYGQVWNTKNVTITNQKDEAIKLGKFNVTPSGKNSFGSLMRGADKLKITTEFGQYLTRKIIELDNEIKSMINSS
jgi:HKD family nuclease